MKPQTKTQAQTNYDRDLEQALKATRRIQSALIKLQANRKADWGDAGTISHLNAELHQITDAIFAEGEYSQVADVRTGRITAGRPLVK